MKLELKNIYKSFEGNEVLKNINLIASSGSAFGLLGRNGAGKTTTSKIIMNLFNQDSGIVLVDGLDIKKSNVKIGYLPEDRGLYPKAYVCDQMNYIGELRGLTNKEARLRSKFLLKKLGAEQYYNKKVDTLSKGNQQKIQLAISIINNPDIIILDEPFSGLDPVNSIILKDIVKELIKEGKLVLISSHEMSFIEEFCDYISIIDKGSIVLKGKLSDIKKQYRNNKVLIASEKHISKIYKLKEENNFIIDIVKENNNVILTLDNIINKVALLDLICKFKIDIDKFYVVEPSLKEIFIKSVGD